MNHQYIKEVTLGKTVYVLPLGNGRHFYGSKLREGTVEKIGKKYFYVRLFSSLLKFDLTNGEYVDNEDTNARYELFASEEQYVNFMEANRKRDKIRTYWNGFQRKPLQDKTIRAIYDLMVNDGAIEPIEE